jgi:hypothetical protein
MQGTPSRRKWIVTGVTGLLLFCALIGGALIFTTCTSGKYLTAAGLPDPDEGYQTGTIYGYDVYIWDCFQGERVVLWRTSAEMTVGQYTRETTACGGQTAIEIKLANEKKRARDPANFW